MSPRLLRPALALASVATVALALSAQAAPTAPLTFTDAANDANLVNSQILVADPVSVSTPVGSQAGLDLLKVTLANQYSKAKKGKKPQCLGFTITMTLSAPPAANSRFRFGGATETNDNFFLFDYDTSVGTTEIRYGGGDDDTTIDASVPAKVQGSTITMTVNSADIKAIGEKPGSLVTDIDASTTASARGLLYFPIFDKTNAGDKTFTICA